MTPHLSSNKALPAHDKPWFSLNRLLKRNTQQRTVTIIGAGIAACQTAWHLTKRGYAVTLIERCSQPAQEGSGNVAGVIFPKITAQPSLGEQFYHDCYHYTLKQLDALQPRLKWHNCGVMQLCHNSREEKRWNTLAKRQLSNNDCQLLSAQQANKIAGIAFNRKASFFPQAGWVEPQAYCHALLDDSNASIITDTAIRSFTKKVSVTSPQVTQTRWQTFNHNQQQVTESDILIIATGRFTDWPFFNELPTQPVKGQTTVAKATSVSEHLKCVIAHAGYITPSHPTQKTHVFGATFERHINNCQITSQADRTNYQQCQTYIPQLAEQLGKQYSGHASVRLGTPDRLPYVGAMPDINAYRKHYAHLHHGQPWAKYNHATYQNNLFVNIGYGARGLTTSALCSKVLAQIINNESPSFNSLLMHAIHPARFLIKSLKKRT